MTVHTAHLHSWRTHSTHLTSDGLVRYQSCSCGRWRILTAAALAVVELAAR